MTMSRNPVVRRRGAVIGPLTEVQRDWHALRTGTCRATALPLPVVVLLETFERGDAVLTRFDVRGDFCGNSWHPTEEAAQLQAESESGGAVGEWVAMPLEAKEGVIEILPRDQASEISKAGQVEKTVRVVSTVDYFLKD